MSVKLTGRVVTAMDKFLGKTTKTRIYICNGEGDVFATNGVTIMRWHVPFNESLGFEGKFYDKEPFALDFAKDKYPATQPVYLCEEECVINPDGLKPGNLDKFNEQVKNIFRDKKFVSCEEKSGQETCLGMGLFDARHIERCVDLAKALTVHDKGKVPAIEMTTTNLGMICTIHSTSLGWFDVAVAGRIR